MIRKSFNEELKKIGSLSESEMSILDHKFKNLDEILNSWTVSKDVKLKVLSELMKNQR